jgi:hypothetical protein
MIIRISQEGQYRVEDDLGDRLNELDDRLLAAVDAGDEKAYQEAFLGLLAFVRDHGDRLQDDDLIGSDVILPPPDLSLAEAAVGLDPDGLIPG